MELFAAYLKYAADEEKAGYLCELLEYGEGVLDMAEKVFKEVSLDEKATFHSNSLCSLLSVSSTNRYRSLDEKAWIEKRSRELAEHNRASELAYAREEAHEKGLEQGLEQGLAEGKLEMAKAMKAKNYSIEEISELTGLSIADIEKL